MFEILLEGFRKITQHTQNEYMEGLALVEKSIINEGFRKFVPKSQYGYMEGIEVVEEIRVTRTI